MAKQSRANGRSGGGATRRCFYCQASIPLLPGGSSGLTSPRARFHHVQCPSCGRVNSWPKAD